MTPDIKLKDFYLQFKREAKVKYEELSNKLKSDIELKEERKKTIIYNKDNLNTKYNINIDDYIEFTDEIYNDKETLYNKIVNFYKSEKDDSNKRMLVAVMDYCNSLRRENNYKKDIDIAETEMNMTIKEYTQWLYNYFTKVHKIVLEGGGFKFGNKLGTYIINNYNIKPKKQQVDYNATRIKKQELLAAGKKIYNENEAAWYKARHIPYDGVPYVVYTTKTNVYAFEFINHNTFHRNKMNFKHNEYINWKYRGLTQKQVADKYCKTKDDVYKLQVDIKYKLNILLYKGYVTHLTYVRNTKKFKHKCGANYS